MLWSRKSILLFGTIAEHVERDLGILLLLGARPNEIFIVHPGFISANPIVYGYKRRRNITERKHLHSDSFSSLSLKPPHPFAGCAQTILRKEGLSHPKRVKDRRFKSAGLSTNGESFHHIWNQKQPQGGCSQYISTCPLETQLLPLIFLVET